MVAGVTAVADDEGAGSESDYGLTTGGGAELSKARYERLAATVGLASSVAVRQVHGTRILEAARPGQGFQVRGEADGLMTSEPGVLLSVTAADCVPVFLADRRGRCVAAVHAGWRGAAAGILERAISGLESRFGVGAEDLEACLGPGICGDCYEVGAEVLVAFGKRGSGPACLDLRLELAARAGAAGISADAVSVLDWCTRCGPVHLHSHRAHGGRAGRMAAFIGLLPGVRGSGSAAVEGELR